jgi:hypothetical protein
MAEENDHRRRYGDLPALPAVEGFFGNHEVPGDELSVPDLGLRFVGNEDPQKLGVEPHGRERRCGHSTKGLEIARVDMLAMALEDRGKPDIAGDEPAAVLAEPALLRRLRSPGNPEARLLEELPGARGKDRSERRIGEALDGNVLVLVVHRSAGKGVEPAEEAELSAPLDEKDLPGPVPARDRETHRRAQHRSIIEWAHGDTRKLCLRRVEKGKRQAPRPSARRDR